MAPSGLASKHPHNHDIKSRQTLIIPAQLVLIGAGPATGAGIARILAHPSHGNLAVALLARRPEALNDLVSNLRSQTPNAVFEAFPTDTSPDKLRQAFADIKAHQSFRDLKLKVSIFSIKNSAKKPFMEETFEAFMDPLET